LSEKDDETLAWSRLQAASSDLFGPRAEHASPYLGILLGFRLPDDMVRRIPQSNPNLLRQRVFTTFGEWAMAVATQKPLVLAFDDLHWADPNSMTLIEYLMTLCADNPLLVLCVSRPDRESPFWPVRQKAIDKYADILTHITLGPMSDNEILTLINSLLNLDYLPSEIEYLILSRAEGNPLFVEEMLRNFIEDGTLVEEDGTWRATRPVERGEVPATLQGMLIARLDRLHDSTKRIVQIAAVIGRLFSKSVLERVVDDPSVLDDGLIELQQAEIIRHRSPEPDPEYIFKHILTQEAAYQSLLTQQRRIYHQQVADALARIFWERGEEYAGAGLVAAHYERAQAWPRVLRYLERAGDGASAIFANNAAVDYYTRALKVADSSDLDATPAQRLVLHEKRGALLASLDDIDSALSDYEQVRTLAQMVGDQKTELRTLNQIGDLQSRLGHGLQAGEYFKQALILAAESSDPGGVADSLNRLGEYYRNSADYEEATAHHQQALEIARSTGDNWLLAASMEGLGQVDLARDDLSASLDKWNQVVGLRRRLADPVGLIKALNALAMLYTWRGEYDQVADVALEAFEFISRVGDLPVVSSLHTYFAISHLIRGDLAIVADHLLAALEVSRQLDHRVMKTHSLVWLGYYYAAIGQLDLALQSSEEAMALASRSTSLQCQVRAATCLGAVRLEKGSIDQAFHILIDAYDQSCQLDSAPDKAEALYELGHANLALANWEATEGLVEQLLSLADLCGLREYQARGRWLRGTLFLAKEDVSGALESLENARQLAKSMGGRLILWKICLATGDAHRAGGHDDQAASAYRRAWDILQSMATTLPTQATTDSMLASPSATVLRAKIDAYG
jgi:tetratricopeptide (TPR) repeat protein